MWNVGKSIIPVGTTFGPYQGTMLSPNEYTTAKESGYAWEILDSAHKKRVVGFVDPGPDPDPATHWMAIINSACYKGIVLIVRSIFVKL